MYNEKYLRIINEIQNILMVNMLTNYWLTIWFNNIYVERLQAALKT